MLNLWPVIPALGLLWRWSRWRVLGALALWFVGSLALIEWRSIEPQPLSPTLLYLASEIGLPMLLIGALCMGNATRAIAPWLLPLLIALVWASIAGVDLLAWIIEAAPRLAAGPARLAERLRGDAVLRGCALAARLVAGEVARPRAGRSLRAPVAVAS